MKSLSFIFVLTDHSGSGEKSSHMYGCDKLLQQRVTKTRLQAVMAKKWAIFTVTAVGALRPVVC
jgi:hypothetical protein